MLFSLLHKASEDLYVDLLGQMVFTHWVCAYFTLLGVHNVKKFDNTGSCCRAVWVGARALMKLYHEFYGEAVRSVSRRSRILHLFGFRSWRRRA
jgi:hypothetical protein